MEPDKFEKHIKKQMNERGIDPSDAAWEKLSSQLPSTNNPKSNKTFWYSVAAVLIGILLVSSLYFNAKVEESVDPEIEVVEAPKEKGAEPISEDIITATDQVEEKVVVSQNKTNKVVEPLEVEHNITKTSNAQFVVLEEREETDFKTNPLANETEQLIEAKIAELVVEVNLLEGTDLQVTDAEVDSLLRKAQQEVLSDRIFSQVGKVDAMALLNEVEGELDQTFREQIFETLKEGFLKVRTAVADRNN